MANPPAADPQLEQTVTVGALPGSTITPPTPGQTVDVRASAAREYVSASVLNWYVNMPRSLEWALDDISRDFGYDIYRRMLLDAQVRAVTNVYKASVLEDEVHLTPAVDDKEEDGYSQAKTLLTQVETMLDRLETPFDDVLWDIMDAVSLGHRMAEQTYALDGDAPGYTLAKLSPRPAEAVAFVVDAYMSVVGILGRVPGQPFTVQQGMLLADVKHTTNLLPRSKFAVLTSRPVNNDPRGTSILRPAFDPWNQKQQIKREFLKYLTQFATPSLIGVTPPDAQSYQALNPNGTLQTDTFGNPVMVTPEEALLAALQNFANGSAVALPYGSVVQAIANTGQGEAFLNAFALFDIQITKAVLHQTLATEEGQHQTRAASGTHKDILDTIVRQAKRSVERMIRRDILETWLRLNGRDALIPLLPKVSLGSIEQEDVTGLWTAAATLRKSGYLHRSQYPDLDDRLGLPKRSPPDADSIPVQEDVRLQDPAGTGINDKGDLDDEDGQNDTPQPVESPGQGQNTAPTDEPATGSGDNHDRH